MGFLLIGIHESYDSTGRKRPVLTPLYHFHQLDEHWDINRFVSAESSPLQVSSGRTRTPLPLC